MAAKSCLLELLSQVEEIFDLCDTKGHISDSSINTLHLGLSVVLEAVRSGVILKGSSGSHLGVPPGVDS